LLPNYFNLSETIRAPHAVLDSQLFFVDHPSAKTSTRHRCFLSDHKNLKGKAVSI
jgi:hypothetical protein